MERMPVPCFFLGMVYIFNADVWTKDRMMERRAWIVNGVVTEVLSAAEGFSFEDCYPPAIVSASVVCAPDVEPGWVYDGKAFSPSSGAVRLGAPADDTLKREVQDRLDLIDKRSVRAQRAILLGAASGPDYEELTALEKEASELREALKKMQ